MANTRVDTVKIARSKLGVRESPPGSNRVEFCAWYGMTGPWCAMFLSWVLATAGNRTGYRFASTASSVAWARRVGRLKPVAHAAPGDVLVRLYTSTTGHTGMVDTNEGATMVTVEGNTGGDDRDGGEVMTRRRSTSWWHYCLALDFDTPTVAPTTPPGMVKVDGEFGPATIIALQRALNRAGANPQLRCEGKFGPRTITQLQARLNHTNGPVAIDGELGPRTIRALQAHVGTPVDGKWGAATTRALQVTLNGNRF